MNGEEYIRTDNYDFKKQDKKGFKIMKKELLETIDATIENIFKWANNEFKQEKKSTSRDMLHQLDENFDDDKLKNEVFEKKLKVIKHLSELLQSRVNIENIEIDK